MYSDSLGNSSGDGSGGGDGDSANGKSWDTSMKMNNKDLKEICKVRKLKFGGNKEVGGWVL